jgi:hypothetical protein
MRKDSREAPTGRQESQQPKERGGAADVDRSKSGEAEDADSPFASPGEDAGANPESPDE